MEWSEWDSPLAITQKPNDEVVCSSRKCFPVDAEHFRAYISVIVLFYLYNVDALIWANNMIKTIASEASYLVFQRLTLNRFRTSTRYQLKLTRSHPNTPKKLAFGMPWYIVSGIFKCRRHFHSVL